MEEIKSQIDKISKFLTDSPDATEYWTKVGEEIIT